MKAQRSRGRQLCLGITACLVLIIVSLAQETKAYELNWTGCGITKNAFMAEIAHAYEKKTGNSIRVSGGGATKGIMAAAADPVNMGGTCRHWKGGPDNKDPLEAEAELVQVAWDALVVIVHPENPVSDITLKGLKDIYEGKETSWSAFGGTNHKIALVTRTEKDSGVGYMFRLLVFGNPHYEFKARSYTVKSTDPLEEKISRTPTAIGIDGISSARKKELKILSLNGVAPIKENIASGRYPLFRPLYLAINKNADQRTRDLVDFVLSPEGQAIVSNQGTVNLEEGRALKPLWLEKSKHFQQR